MGCYNTQENDTLHNNTQQNDIKVYGSRKASPSIVILSNKTTQHNELWDTGTNLKYTLHDNIQHNNTLHNTMNNDIVAS